MKRDRGGMHTPRAIATGARRRDATIPAASHRKPAVMMDRVTPGMPTAANRDSRHAWTVPIARPCRPHPTGPDSLRTNRTQTAAPTPAGRSIVRHHPVRRPHGCPIAMVRRHLPTAGILHHPQARSVRCLHRARMNRTDLVARGPGRSESNRPGALPRPPATRARRVSVVRTGAPAGGARCLCAGGGAL